MPVLLSRRSVSALLLASLIALPSRVRAHAVIVSAAPPPGAVVHGANLSVLLRFNSRIDHQRSRLTLVRPDASSVSLPLAASDSPDTLAAEANGLKPGRYRLRWQVLAIDGHITRGDIPFEIAP
ncbi:MAG TPA: copper resistance CopC family protein [Stellaceae bacterium]|nr:copper resistance CopC family protein [Stellaceae bacterium]